jgi:hypothetical protein
VVGPLLRSNTVLERVEISLLPGEFAFERASGGFALIALPGRRSTAFWSEIVQQAARLPDYHVADRLSRRATARSGAARSGAHCQIRSGVGQRSRGNSRLMMLRARTRA